MYPLEKLVVWIPGPHHAVVQLCFTWCLIGYVKLTRYDTYWLHRRRTLFHRECLSHEIKVTSVAFSDFNLLHPGSSLVTLPVLLGRHVFFGQFDPSNTGISARKSSRFSISKGLSILFFTRSKAKLDFPRRNNCSTPPVHLPGYCAASSQAVGSRSRLSVNWEN